MFDIGIDELVLIFPYVYLSIIGSALASFYVTLGDRILLYFYGEKRKEFLGKTRWKAIFYQPSHCPNCSVQLTPTQLIPIFGYLISKGKCKNCKIPISKLHPLSEFFFVILAIFVYYESSSILGTLFFLLFMGHLLCIGMTDAKHLIIDYEHIPFLLVFGLVTNYYLWEEIPCFGQVWIFFGFFLFYLLIFFVYRGGTGFGDVLLSPILATVAGNPYWIVYWNASYVLAIFVTALTRKKGDPWKGIKIPMGLFFGMGIFITYIWKLFFPNGILEEFTL